MVRVIERGGTIAYPAETMYGLGGDGLSADLVSTITQLKRRPEAKGFILLVDSVERATCLCSAFPESARKLAEKYWPGPLTLLLEAADPNSPVAAGGKLAVRLPDSPWIREWVRLSDRPLLSTSANRAGKPPARSAEEVQETFLEDLDLLVIGPSFDRSLIPSTIVDTTTDPPQVVREGRLCIDR